MTATIAQMEPNVVFSVHRWLATLAYRRKGEDTGPPAKTFAGRFGTVDVRPGYPDDLTALRNITLAVTGPIGTEDGDAFYGGDEAAVESRLTFTIFGFIVGQGPHERSILVRDQLKNDVAQVCRVIGGDAGLTLYDAVTETELGDLEITAVSSRLIPETALGIEADRYKFAVEAELAYVA